MIPDIPAWHPQIVHFVIALGFVGIGLRVASLFLWKSWTRPAGAVLLILAAAASVAAVESGDDAHGPVERIPGTRDLVVHHEELGEKARNLFLAIAGLELIALVLTTRPKALLGVHAVSAVLGLYAGLVLYEAAEHGGEIVYNYGGGPGLRSGDTADVRRLLVAGLYNQARLDREAGRSEEAARLTDELARRVPGDRTVQLLAIESRIRDRREPMAALAELMAMSIPADTMRLVIRHGLLVAEALAAAGLEDSARAELQRLSQRYPESQAVKQALAGLDQ
jgi:uncharacterized membrane protein